MVQARENLFLLLFFFFGNRRTAISRRVVFGFFSYETETPTNILRAARFIDDLCIIIINTAVYYSAARVYRVIFSTSTARFLG